MASTIKVPLLGQQNKGTVVGVTIGGFAIAGYMIYRSSKKKQAAAAAAAASSSQAASGYGYGSGALPGGYYGYGEPGITYGYGASGGFTPTGYYGYGTPIGGGGIPNATNAQWAQAAINQLSSEGYDPQAVSAALGAYELGQPVSPSQQTIIQAAIGIEGYPPQSGAGGFPPGIHLQGTPGGGSGGGQGGGGHGGGGSGGGHGGGGNKATIPAVTGERAEEGLADVRQAGFKAKTTPLRNPRKTYVISGQSPPGGTQATRGSLVTLHVRAE